ncbi:MAG: LPXTG cell wall anchor domain-containing protein [Oscillospiraceae bacterium]|nr:LPXTG cell wall anchor domain-containing protein [Oscillospiraceae bacterium]
MYNYMAEIYHADEFVTTETVPHTNHAENPLETNPVLLYSIMIALLVILGVALYIRKKKNK